MEKIRKLDKKVTMRTIALALSLIMAMAVFTGCGGSGDSGDSVVTAGSTSVQPVSEELAAAFMEENPDITVEVQGGGSGQGIKSIEEGIADIGALSREVAEEEKEAVGNEYVIARDGIAVIVNTETGVDDLTIDQVQQIYTGEITNWSEVGGNDAPITVVSREEGSGTRDAFSEITGVLGDDETDNTTKDAVVQSSTGAMIETVSTTPDSIGYASIGALDDSVKALMIDGVEATEENVLAESYPISRPFVYVTGAEISDAAQAYIDFAMSDEGQKIIEELGYISVN